jgi:hypothetical protein
MAQKEEARPVCRLVSQVENRITRTHWQVKLKNSFEKQEFEFVKWLDERPIPKKLEEYCQKYFSKAKLIEIASEQSQKVSIQCGIRGCRCEKGHQRSNYEPWRREEATITFIEKWAFRRCCHKEDQREIHKSTSEQLRGKRWGFQEGRESRKWRYRTIMSCSVFFEQWNDLRNWGVQEAHWGRWRVSVAWGS